MSKTPNYDAKVKAILDATEPGERTCSITGKQWKLEEEEIKWIKKFNVPPSSVDPEVRMDILNGFNTGLALFWKPHMRTGEPMLSAVHPDSPIPVVTETEWTEEDYVSDKHEIDWSRSVIDQVWDLVCTYPTKPTRNVDCVDSIVSGSVGARNSYIGGAALNTTRCYYMYALLNGEDCIDVVNSERVQRSYYASGAFDVADSAFVFESRSCFNCTFIFDCCNCEHCFGAVNKRNKKYLWFNEQLSEEEWKKRYDEVDLTKPEQLKEYKTKFYDLWKNEGVWPNEFGWGNEGASGDHMIDCVRCHKCFWQTKSTDLFRCRFGAENTDSAYTSGTGWQNNVFTSTGGVYGSKSVYCVSCFKCMGTEYSYSCQDCENCFGCVSLKRKKFCIFNKQYLEDEYWELVDRLKCKMLDEGEYGEFFPAKFSQSGFQFSVGETFYGYSEDELKIYSALILDPKRGQVLAPKREDLEDLSVDDIPSSPDDPAAEKLIGKRIYDAVNDRHFTFYPGEIDLYQQKHWPLPREHWTGRITHILRHSNTPREIEVDCDSCGNKTMTYKNLIFSERKILCRECYLKYLEQYG